MSVVEVAFKTCSRCKESKPLTEFKPRKDRSSGIKSNCKKCDLHYGRVWQKSNRDKRNTYYRKWSQTPKRQVYQKAKRDELKLKAYLKVGRGKIECVCGCGCNDIRFLEINHINGGGGKELKQNHWHFYHAIVSGKREIDDLELACTPYNRGSHAMVLKYKLEKAPFKIIYCPN